VRTPAAVLILGLALAVGTPAAWTLTRPSATAGPPVTQLLQPAPASSSPAADQLPVVPAHPAVPPPEVAIVPPVRVAVPGAGIDAVVDPVGVEPEGGMSIPADVDRVGWYRFGPVPGAAQGTAVLAGHVDDRDQGLGALAPLRTIEPGTELLVTDAVGAVVRWRVVSRELIDKRRVPLDLLFTRTGPPRLVLLTCGGPFLAQLHGYRDNVVVVAEPAP
jgi:hypothetical protein